MSNAYSDLEPEVANLARMARLAEIQLNKAVGQLRCEDGKYVEVPDYEATDLAIFAVSQMAKMVERFEELYYSQRSRERTIKLGYGPPAHPGGFFFLTGSILLRSKKRVCPCAPARRLTRSTRP